MTMMARRLQEGSSAQQRTCGVGGAALFASQHTSVSSHSTVAELRGAWCAACACGGQWWWWCTLMVVSAQVWRHTILP